MSRRYQSREAVYVDVAEVTGGYGFLTNLTQGDQASLGHQPVATAAVPIFFGAQRPKPPRARNTGSGVSSFVDQSIDTLPNGWVLAARGKSPPRPRSTSKTKLVYIAIGTAKYCWYLPNETADKIGTLEALGIKAVTANDRGFVGVNRVTPFPGYPLRTRPFRAKKISEGEGGTDTVSSFVESSKIDSLPEGWVVVD